MRSSNVPVEYFKMLLYDLGEKITMIMSNDGSSNGTRILRMIVSAGQLFRGLYRRMQASWVITCDTYTFHNWRK